ncbi:hypothetical protein [Acetobacter sp. LMG 32666]|uniref:hypothetical protein n=1 Tax=Acetobacter sp. LMG 32666 TaxID=2959295 RepID=UPI0030C7C819
MNINIIFKDKNKILILIFILWSVITAYLVCHHALWRDEVRNFMIGIGATPHIHLIGNPHPFLTYKIEQIFYWIMDSYYALPLSSLLISFCTVIMLLFFSPFDVKTKILMLFGYPLLYEYTVMDRNYGISALLLMLFAYFFSNKNYRYICSGPILFLLANTNVHSALIVGVLSGLWPLNVWYENGRKWNDETKKAVINGLMGLSGFVVCLLTIYPIRYDLAPAHPLEIVPKHHLHFLKNLTFVECKDYISNFIGDKTLGKIIFIIFQSAAYAFILLSVFALWGDTFLFSVVAIVLIGFTVFFSIIYPGRYRHEALWIMLVFALLWIKKNTNREPASNTLTKIGLVSFYGMLSVQCLLSIMLGFHEVKIPNSRSKEFSNFVSQNETLKDSPVLSSLDYILESIPYYTKKPVFMLTLKDFDFVVPYKNVRNYNLDDLLHTAQKLAACSKSPPLILIVNDRSKTKGSTANIMDSIEENSIRKYMYDYWTFTATSEQKKRFLEKTHKIAQYPNGYLEEGFIVYELNVDENMKSSCSRP